jgi:hypothetical protein
MLPRLVVQVDPGDCRFDSRRYSGSFSQSLIDELVSVVSPSAVR